MGVSPVFAESATFFGPRVFTKDRGVPTTFTEQFSVPSGASDFQLIVTDGRGKTGDVKNAVITLNGVKVISVPDLRPEGNVQKVLSFPLLSVNELTVTLNGPAGNSVSVQLIGTAPSGNGDLLPGGTGNTSGSPILTPGGF